MMQETPELDRLRLAALRTSDEHEFNFCQTAYKRKGGLRKLVFVKSQKIKQTYKKITRFSKGNYETATYYRNQISKELERDCAGLRASGMAFEDIAIALEKNYGFVKERTAKYACALALFKGIKPL